MVFARKRFGQNFLQNKGIIQQIVQALQAKPDDTVIEIGPGRGALTEILLQQLNQLIAIEIDKDLFANLTQLPQSHKLKAICQDALKVDLSEFGSNLHLIGNLPYNISTPLLFHFLKYRHLIHDMVFMLQHEVVERLIAKSQTANFGRLSVIFQYYCDIEYLIHVPPEAFNPQPKVDSAVFSLKPKKDSHDILFEDLEFIVGKAFAMRRKTLNNNFKNIFTASHWEAINIDPSLRAQDLSIPDFVKLTQFYTKHIKH